MLQEIYNRKCFFFLMLKYLVSNFSYSFYLPLIWLFWGFFLIRVPFVYSMESLLIFLIILIFPLFLSLTMTRLSFKVNWFFATMIPIGTPLWVSPLVGVAELISYIIRPFVLVLRPFLNISIGVFIGMAFGPIAMTKKFFFNCWMFLFFYELFVAYMQWYMVTAILTFSMNH